MTRARWEASSLWRIDPVTSAVIVAVDQAGFVGDGAELPDNRLQLLVHHRAGVEPYRALVRCVALATDLRDFICGAPPAARPDGSSEVRKSLNSVYGLTNPSFFSPLDEIDAEALVENLYRQIQLPPAWVRQLTEELEAEIVRSSGRGIGASNPSDEDARQARGGAGQAPACLLRERDPARSPQGGTGPHRRSRAGIQCRARDDAGRPRRLAGHSPNGHPTRRQLLRGVPEGAAVCSATLQRRGAPGRLHQGPEDRSNGALGGIRASLLSPEFE